MALPDSIVFDTEPLVAYADGEPGSDAVSNYLDAIVKGNADGTVNIVNATEVRYILARKYDRTVADQFLEWLWTIGLTTVDAESVWQEAAEYIVEYNPALGDAYALGTAALGNSTLLVGGDEDYDDIDDVSIEQFRDHGV